MRLIVTAQIKGSILSIDLLKKVETVWIISSCSFEDCVDYLSFADSDLPLFYSSRHVHLDIVYVLVAESRGISLVLVLLILNPAGTRHL